MPAPPGTHTRSSFGHSANVVEGSSRMPPSATTGSRVFETRCTSVSGNRMKTSYGPVRSSWVSLGNKRRPIWNCTVVRSCRLACDSTSEAASVACCCPPVPRPRRGASVSPRQFSDSTRRRAVVHGRGLSFIRTPCCRRPACTGTQDEIGGRAHSRAAAPSSDPAPHGPGSSQVVDLLIPVVPSKGRGRSARMAENCAQSGKFILP